MDRVVDVNDRYYHQRTDHVDFCRHLLDVNGIIGLTREDIEVCITAKSRRKCMVRHSNQIAFKTRCDLIAVAYHINAIRSSFVDIRLRKDKTKQTKQNIRITIVF